MFLLSTLLTLLAAALLTRAHVTIQPSTAPRNTFTVVSARVPHGCDGNATTELVISIPEGVSRVKPQMIPGWQVEITMRPLSPPIVSEGQTINTTVDRVRYYGGVPIPDNLFMDFGLSIRTPDRTGRILWPVTQKCTIGELAWTQVPSGGDGKSESLRYPAAGLTLVDPPPAAAGSGPASTPGNAQAQKGSGAASVTVSLAALTAPALALAGLML